ncbi:MAG: phosphoenolpyruvate carboxylase [Aestuariivirga sp.]
MSAPLLEDTSYIDEITAMLRGLLRQVIKAREPDVLPILDDAKTAQYIKPQLVEHALQAISIWLQLMNIAEENATVRSRRAVEKQTGPDDVGGSLSQSLAQAAANGVKDEQVSKVLQILDVGPTITAHPTEAKRVTVLEIHRRIYLKLFELDNPRWTPRERDAMLFHLRNEIDLLWMTGEVRAEKPSVEDEVAWGLHFFRDALFDRTTAVCDTLLSALQRHFPDATSALRPPLKFSSWIGGDRDGNPFVTVETTKAALRANASASVMRLSKKLNDLAGLISISSAEMAIPASFAALINEQLALSGKADIITTRNSAEPFRQYFTALRERLESTFEQNGTAKPIINVDELIGLLAKAEAALDEMRAAGNFQEHLVT